MSVCRTKRVVAKRYRRKMEEEGERVIGKREREMGVIESENERKRESVI